MHVWVEKFKESYSMDDYSEIVDFTKISDSKVDETHSDSHCKFSRHIIDVFDDN